MGKPTDNNECFILDDIKLEYIIPTTVMYVVYIIYSVKTLRTYKN